MMRNGNFDDGQVFHSATCNYKVQQDEPLEFVFNESQQERLGSGGHVAGLAESTEVLEVAQTLSAENTSFRAQGFAFDDDNEPALENITTENYAGSEPLSQPWESKPLEMKRSYQVKDGDPNVVRDNAHLHAVMDRFLRFLPVNILKTTVIKATNTTLSDPLTWQELLEFLGLLLLLGGSTQGDARSVFWAHDTSDLVGGGPLYLHSYMPRHRFESIIKHLKFTTNDSSAPLQQSFHQVSELNGAFIEDEHCQFGCRQQGQINCSNKRKSNSIQHFAFPLNRGKHTKPKRDSGLLESKCGVETAPPYAGTWTGARWEFLSSKYPQHVCKTIGCPKRIRTYCKCMIGHWMCQMCIGIHIASVVEHS
jgi:hypothetical protein